MKKVAILCLSFLFLTPIFHLQAQTQKSSVDLLWQGKTYTPPFYKGASLWSNQSQIVFFAVPQIAGGNPSNLSYKWSKNGTVLGSASGVGKNSLIFADTILSKPQTVSVDVISSSGTLLASNSVTVAPASAGLLAYENNPLYGIMFNKEVDDTYPLKEREVTFSAFPIFFTANTRFNPNIRYQWLTNSGSVGTDNSVTYRAPDGEAGTSSVTVTASSKTWIAQDKEKSFLVQFGNTTGI